MMIRSFLRVRRPASAFQQASASTSTSSFSTTAPTTPDDEDEQQRRPPPDNYSNSATIVQGPSLLVSTGVHRPSPSLFHLPGLRSLPFWTAPTATNNRADDDRREEEEERRRRRRHRIAFNDPIVSDAVSHVESHYDAIKSEYFAAVLGRRTMMTTKNDPEDNDADDGAIDARRPLEPDYDVSSRGGEHANDALHTGSWDWHSCVLNGTRNDVFRERCPRTAGVVDDLEREGMLFGTPFGFCFFSTLHGRSSIKAHTGPMNLRLRIHLPLVVPRDDDAGGDAPSSSASSSERRRRRRPIAGIRVADQVREWHEGSALVLDDSYVHEAWNDSDDCRVVFLLDIWHPDVRAEERERIANMFEYAKGKGWIGSGSGSGGLNE